MKKLRKPALVLSLETLRKLSVAELAHVQGGLGAMTRMCASKVDDSCAQNA